MKGGVTISRAGEPCRYAKRPLPGGGYVVEVYDGGEEYAVCCPMCSDTRRRCYVNHKFDTEIAGAEVLYPVHCWNEECQRKGLAKWFLERYRAWRSNNYMPPAAGGAPADVVMDKPMTMEDMARHSAGEHVKLSGVQKLSSLLRGHQALEYLLARGFDPAALERDYGVGYKGRAYKYTNSSMRIVIPIRWGGYEVGWQARAIPGHSPLTFEESKKGKSWPYRQPKYFTSPGFLKGKFLYNIDVAAGYDTVVLVEGVTDAWRVGPWGAAMFGKSLSYDQIRLLVDSCAGGGRWIVMLTDAWTAGDVAKSWRKNFFDVMAAYPHKDRIRMLPVPKGDPGDYPQDELARMVTFAMRSRQEDLAV